MTFSNSLLSSSKCTTPPHAVPVINESSCPGPPHLPSYVSPITTSTPQPQPAVTAVPPSHVSPAVPVPEHEGELKYISKYLVQYVPVKQSKVSGTGKCAAGAKMLINK